MKVYVDAVYVDADCDATGGKRLNLRLLQQRASIVSAYLEDHGIASDRLVAWIRGNAFHRWK